MFEKVAFGILMLFAGAVLIIAFPIGKDVPPGNFAFVALGAAIFVFPFFALLIEILTAIKSLEETIEAKAKKE